MLWNVWHLVKKNTIPCWCHFIEALKKVRLYEVAQKVQKCIKKSQDSVSLASPPDVDEAHTEHRNAHSEQPCTAPSPGTDKDNVHIKVEKAAMPLEKSSSLDRGEDSGHKNDDGTFDAEELNDDNTFDVEELIIFIENDLPKDRRRLFASKLLSNEEIISINRKGIMKVRDICKAAFVKEHPVASCMKIVLALQEVGCDDLAKTFHACFCISK